ncbi:MAG: YfcE family phosphodiesterase [Gammaproteobacteria bacterium]|nr:YfcE family phosphodiesterase [Gammaproteobacteria bacterium]
MNRNIKADYHDFSENQDLTIIILSDTHGVIDSKILELVEPESLVLHAGDVMSGEVLDQLALKAKKVIAVKGNNDTEYHWGRSFRGELNELPDVVHIELHGGRLSMEHGHRVLDLSNYHGILREKYWDSKAVVYGHTHIETLDVRETPWMINPGASGKTRTHGGPSCMQLSISAGEWTVQRHKFKTR